MIKRITSEKTIKKSLDKFFVKKLTDTTYAMSAAGIDVMNVARSSANYKNRTGGLRASTGFRVFYNKKNVIDNFKGGNSEGVENGREIANQFNKSNDPELILVAGQDYAGHVEDNDYTVLTDFIDEDKILKTIKDIVEWLRFQKYYISY